MSWYHEVKLHYNINHQPSLTLTTISSATSFELSASTSAFHISEEDLLISLGCCGDWDLSTRKFIVLNLYYKLQERSVMQSVSMLNIKENTLLIMSNCPYLDLFTPASIVWMQQVEIWRLTCVMCVCLPPSSLCRFFQKSGFIVFIQKEEM